MESAVADADASAVRDWSLYRFRLRSAFIDLLYAQELLPVVEQIAQRRAAMADTMESRYRSGLESKGAQAMSRAVLAEARQDAADAAYNLSLCRGTLARLLALKEPLSTRAAGELESSVPTVTNSFEELALNTPDYRVAACAMRRAEGQVALARSRHGLQLSLVANVSPRSDTWAQDSPDWFAGIRMAIPLYTGGRKDLDVSAARHDAERVAAGLVALRRNLAMEVEAAHAGCRAAAAWVQLAPDGLAAAQLCVDIARREAEAGLSPFSRWEQAEDNLARRQQAYLKSRRDAALARARWERLVGADAAERNGEP
jgi:outer membrane protein TolC